jgi:hypothetical protein
MCDERWAMSEERGAMCDERWAMSEAQLPELAHALDNRKPRIAAKTY